MLKMTDKEKRILSITLASFGVFMVCSGLIMNAQVKPIINTKYTLSVRTKKVSEAQAKKNEIKVKNFELEINTPISVDVKDYIEEADKLNPEIIKKLKLDTSLVNITQVGTYQYTITYGKKKYVGNIKIKEKEVKAPPFTVKEKITIPKNGTLDNYNKSYYLNSTPPEEVLQNIIIDTSAVDLGKTGTYQFVVRYLDTNYTGTIEVVEAFTPPAQQTQPQEQPKPEKQCPPNAIKNPENKCICPNDTVLNEAANTCDPKTTTNP